MSSAANLFNTAVTGMQAQTGSLAAISQNIANSSTVGYKEATTHFLTMLTTFKGDSSGGVTTRTRWEIGGQGSLMPSASPTDLAILGSGFFVVQDSGGKVFLTRAGSFVPDSQGFLVNAAGFFLMGYTGGPNSVDTSSGLAGMTRIKIASGQAFATATTAASITANLPAFSTTNATKYKYNLTAPATPTNFTAKTSITAYDNLGNARSLNLYFANTSSTANTWSFAVYEGATLLGTASTLTFSGTTGAILPPNTFSFTLPASGGSAASTFTVDLSKTTQLGSDFGVNALAVDGNAASTVSSLQISGNGEVDYVLANGQSVPAYTIALADVASPSNMESSTGNVFTPTLDSGQPLVGVPGSTRFGKISANNLEASTVDLASQLASMIVTQRSYVANTQVFQVASEVLQVLNNLK